MMTTKQRNWVGRIGILAMGLLMIGTAVFDIWHNRLVYPNYWGGVVFAPFAIVAGALVIYIVLFRSKDLDKPRRDKNGQPIPWKSPDWKKW